MVENDLIGIVVGSEVHIYSNRNSEVSKIWCERQLQVISCQLLVEDQWLLIQMDKLFLVSST